MHEEQTSRVVSAFATLFIISPPFIIQLAESINSKSGILAPYNSTLSHVPLNIYFPLLTNTLVNSNSRYNGNNKLLETRWLALLCIFSEKRFYQSQTILILFIVCFTFSNTLRNRKKRLGFLKFIFISKLTSKFTHSFKTDQILFCYPLTWMVPTQYGFQATHIWFPLLSNQIKNLVVQLWIRTNVFAYNHE